jgi:hypothetical protein
MQCAEWAHVDFGRQVWSVDTRELFTAGVGRLGIFTMLSCECFFGDPIFDADIPCIIVVIYQSACTAS